MYKRNVIAMLCTAVVVVGIALSLGYNGAPEPESTLPELAPIESGDYDGVLDTAVDYAEIGQSDEQASEVAGGSPSDEPEYVPGVVLVKIDEGYSIDQVNEQLAGLDYITTPSISEDDLVYGYVELELAEGVGVDEASAMLADVDFASASQPNYVYYLQDASGDDSAYAADALQAGGVDFTAQSTVITDLYAGKQWALEAVHAYQAWDYYRSETAEAAGNPVTVAVIDSGMNVNHEDFESDRIVGAQTYLTGKSGSDVTDLNGHGTHVAGIIAATADNGKGVAGVSYNARIMPVQVLDENGGTNAATLMKGFKYVADHADEYNVRVVNVSIGTTAADYENLKDTALTTSIASLHENGNLLVVYAAGNYGSNGAYNSAPCDLDNAAEAIGVISVRRNSDGSYQKASTSNYNMEGQTTKDISAPGNSILSTYIPGKDDNSYIKNSDDQYDYQYGYQSGTSMAAPYVSGIAALVFAANPSYSAEEAGNILCDTAQDLGATGWDEAYGAGLVDAEAALKAAVPDAAPILSGGDTLKVGDSMQFSIPNSSSSWSWSSSDESVATVSDGTVVGVGAGSATITATSGNIELSQVMNVYDPTILGDSAMPIGTAVQLSVSPSNPSGAWTWTSSDPSVVRVLPSPTGAVYGEGLGTATITVSLVSDPSISASREVVVEKADVANAEILGVTDQVYTGSAITFPNMVVRMCSTVSGITGYTDLVEGTDYEVTYAGNTDVGIATITVTGIGNYTGTLEKTFRVASYTLEDATTATINAESATYTGSAIEPGVTVVVDEKTLSESTDGGATGDYVVEYRNNVNAGMASVTVTGVNNYAGSLYGGFLINAAPISSVSVSGIVDKTYTGSNITQNPTLTYNGMTLSETSDYSITYYNRKNAGTASMVIRGWGNYTGTRTETFAINPAPLSETSVSLGSATYNGSAQELSPTVTFNGSVLKSGTDYTVLYPSDCTNVGTKQVTITPGTNGNFEGSKTAEYAIAQASIASATVSLSSTSYIYDGKAKEPTVTVKLDSRTLTKGADYTVKYSNNTAIGTATVTVKGEGNYTGTVEKTFAITAPKKSMYRLYNPNSGEHFYTSSIPELNNVVFAGWTYEGIGWKAPSASNTPVYRLYNKYGGEHHYTTSKAERDKLVNLGWKYEGIGWYSDDAKGVPLYRLYNPNAFANNHHYTTSKAERDKLVGLGWKDEGYAWYGMK